MLNINPTRDETLGKMDPDILVQFAVQLAEDAGHVLTGLYGLTEFDIKEDGSLQTAADIKSERLIYEGIKNKFPQTDVLSEENSYLLNDREFLWVCDPLDGTTNFTNHFPSWGISIALMKSLEPLIGVIHIPLFHETILAVKGHGVYCNGKKAELKNTNGNQFSDIYTFCSWRSNSFSSNLPGNIRALGSTAFHIAQFAFGRSAGGWELGSKIWDIAAGRLIIQEAGGIIRLLDGRDPLELIKSTKNIREQTIPCIFAANQEIYELMQKENIQEGKYGLL